MTADSNDNRIYAYEVCEPLDMPITTGPVARAWMDAMPQRAPYRCLPMTIANQAGWMIPSPVGFTAVWDGGMGLASLRVDFDNAPPQAQSTAFGVTFVAAP